MAPQPPHNELLPQLYKQEYTRMTAVLCRRFGLKHIEAAEDIASDTFLKASEHWAIHGIPDHPTAWLHTVAGNKAKDHLRHLSVREMQTPENTRPDSSEKGDDFEFSDQYISDSCVAMIFAVCNPTIPVESQICLALQILCGFSVEEIAHAFLSKTETIKKRLQRARATLRSDHFQIRTLNTAEIKSRSDAALRTLYLLFNEGYFSKTGDRLIRKDLCSEALSLTLTLTDHNLTDTPQTNALIALMCFQSSRLDARINEQGETVLFEEQDKNLWDQSLIEKGNYYLVNACTGNEISKYHLEAGIAYWHTTSTGQDKWQHILQLYNQLLLIEYSAVTALNRTFAFARVYGNPQALVEAGKLGLTQNSDYHQLLGYLHATMDIDSSIYHYQQAVELTNSETEKQTLGREIERLRKKV